MIQMLANSDWVDCGSPSALDDFFTGGATICMFFDVGTIASNCWLMDKQLGGPTQGWDFLMESSGLLAHGEHWSGGYGYFNSNTALSDDTKHHLALKYDNNSSSNTPTFYIDGVNDGYSTVLAPSGTRDTDAGENLILGNYYAGNGPCLDGSIGDVRIYSRMLSDAEVAAIAHGRGQDNIKSGLIGHWPLNELAPGVAATAASSCKDIVGGNHGSPASSPQYTEHYLKGP